MDIAVGALDESHETPEIKLDFKQGEIDGRYTLFFVISRKYKYLWE